MRSLPLISRPHASLIFSAVTAETQSGWRYLQHPLNFIPLPQKHGLLRGNFRSGLSRIPVWR